MLQNSFAKGAAQVLGEKRMPAELSESEPTVFSVTGFEQNETDISAAWENLVAQLRQNPEKKYRLLVTADSPTMLAGFSAKFEADLKDPRIVFIRRDNIQRPLSILEIMVALKSLRWLGDAAGIQILTSEEGEILGSFSDLPKEFSRFRSVGQILQILAGGLLRELDSSIMDRFQMALVISRSA